MSYENPGDGVRCDHCNQPGVPYTYKGRTFSGLVANRGERLCRGEGGCLERAVQAEQDAPVGPLQIPARDYVTVIAPEYRYADYVRPKRGRKQSG